MSKISIIVTIIENMIVGAELHVTDFSGKKKFIANIKTPLISLLQKFFSKVVKSQNPVPDLQKMYEEASSLHSEPDSILVKDPAHDDPDFLSLKDTPTNFDAELSEEGVNGTYFIKDKESGTIVAIFKPQDEEANAKHSPKKDQENSSVEGILPEEAAAREIAAYLLDKDGFYDVPPTFLATLSHHSFYHPERGAEEMKTKTGSYQHYSPHDCSSWDIGPASFPVDQVHKIGILDLQILNVDRHGGNILIQKTDAGLKLIPIDHGYSLPDKLGSKIWFEWMNWEQSRLPFSQRSKDHVAAIDLEANLRMLEQRLHIRPECLKMMKVSTTLLKKGVENDLTLYDIGSIVCRTTSPDLPSPLEDMCHRAEALSLGDQDSFFKILFPLMDEAVARLSPSRASHRLSSVCK